MAYFIVTGAAGFIGSKIAERLIERGHHVITVDNLSTGYKENIPKGVKFFEMDCQNPKIHKTLPQVKYEAIFHIAGQSSGEISFENPTYDLRTNTESTLNLLKFSLSVGCRRFIYASSMSVYGVKPDRAIKENDSTIPISFYGIGKLASEHYLRLYEQYGICSTSLRIFNTYGPGQNLNNLKQGMVSIYMAQMLEKQHIIVKGSMNRYRDFIYIDDVTDAFLRCLNYPESYGKVINIGSGVRTCVDKLLEKLISLYTSPVSFKSKDTTPGDLHGIYADISLGKKLLGFKPLYPLDKGLKTMLEWAESKIFQSKIKN